MVLSPSPLPSHLLPFSDCGGVGSISGEPSHVLGWELRPCDLTRMTKTLPRDLTLVITCGGNHY